MYSFWKGAYNLKKRLYGEAMKNKIVGFILMVILLFVNSNVIIYAKETPDELKNLYARSAVLMDADNGRILFGKNESMILPMASTTKIMTCILALEYMNGEEVCAVSENASKQPKVHLGVHKDEKYYMKDLLYSLMLESHNDSAVVIAEKVAGSVEEFADLMNRKAKELGCKNTYFITPNGLDAEDKYGIHSTTAADLALIMRYCIKLSPKKEEFLKITQTENYQFMDVDNKRTFNCYNHNALLKMMSGVISGKTGFTNDAGYCYVGAVSSEGKTFVAALLACGWPNNKNYKWQDSKKLIEYGMNNYEYKSLESQWNEHKVYVKNGMNRYNIFDRNVYVDIKVADENNKIKLLIGKDEKVDIKIIKQEQLKAPVREEEVIGVMLYMIDEKVQIKQPIVTVNEVKEKDIRNYLCYIFQMYINKELRIV